MRYAAAQRRTDNCDWQPDASQAPGQKTSRLAAASAKERRQSGLQDLQSEQSQTQSSTPPARANRHGSASTTKALPQLLLFVQVEEGNAHGMHAYNP